MFTTPNETNQTNSASVIAKLFLPTPIELRYKQHSYNPFPLDELSPTLKGAVEAIVDVIQCPVEMAASSVFSVASLAAQTHADVVNPLGQRSPLSLNYITVGISGERKSSADKLAMVPVRNFERELEVSYNSQMGHYKKERTAWETKKKAILRRSAKSSRSEIIALINKECGPEPVKPMLPNLTASEPTLEGLLTQFQNGWPSMGIFSDEGSTFIGGHGMTDETRLRTGAALCRFWDGTEVDRVRKSLEESFKIKNRRLSLHLMVQPKIVEDFIAHEDLQALGLFSRCLISWPESNIGTRFQHDIDVSSQPNFDAYVNQLTRVFKKPLSLLIGTTNELMPTKMMLDDEAKQQWIAYSDYIEQKQIRGGEYESIRGFASKIVENALRIAGVMTIVENPQAEVIDKYMLWRGANLMEYYASQQLRIFDSANVDEETRNAELLLKWLHNEYNDDHVTMRVIQQYGPNRFKSTQLLRRTVAMLLSYNWLVNAPEGVHVQGHKVRGSAWLIQR